MAIIKELIVAIDNCPSDRLIVLVFTGYAISAVAYLLAYFAFYSVTRENVIVQAQGPLCLVYHKPRIKKYAVTLFANSLDSKNTYSKEVECMRKYTMNFDHIYDALERACIKKGIEIAPHMKAIYNMNGDISVTFNGGPL
ncbi:hypothetical protein ACL2XP_06975 [Sodalis sp. RH21]|uniref:hypothetical protein n=1 Tax=unclassified Sodalis (in: enterobacteria) TaxID=2636512 RepID=UPI0039B36CFA